MIRGVIGLEVVRHRDFDRFAFSHRAVDILDRPTADRVPAEIGVVLIGYGFVAGIVQVVVFVLDAAYAVHLFVLSFMPHVHIVEG